MSDTKLCLLVTAVRMAFISMDVISMQRAHIINLGVPG